MNLGLILITCAVGMVMIWMHFRHRSRVKARRGNMYAECKSLFTSAEIIQDDVNFPMLSGQYQGFPVKLEPVADHIGYRKLPSLWLMITVKAEIPYDGIFDFLVRPQNIEFFSPSEQLEFQINPPENWPQYAVLKTNNIDKMPPQHLLDKHVSLFDDNKVKELLISPRGIRIVYQINQAEQGTYRTLRTLAFNDLSVNPEVISNLINTAISIQQDLAEKTTHEIPAKPNANHEYLKAVG